PVPAPKAAASEELGSGTAIAPLATVLKPATPFQAGAAHAPRDRVAPAVRLQAMDDPIGSGTVIAPMVAVVASSATPFEKRGAAPTSAELLGSGTAIAPAPALPRAAVPFQQPIHEGPTRQLPALTVEQYAWLAAELRNAPAGEIDATLS